MRLASVGRMALNRGTSNPPLCTMSFFLVERGTHLAKRRFVFLQLAGVTSYQLHTAVQNVNDTLAYTIHEFFGTFRDDCFTQFRFGRIQLLESVVI